MNAKDGTSPVHVGSSDFQPNVAQPVKESRIAEIGPLRDVVKNPQHPYTAGLMDSIPKVGEEKEQLSHIRGSMPRLQEIPPGCPFHPRCPETFDRCRAERPDLMPAGHPNQDASCWKFAGKVRHG